MAKKIFSVITIALVAIATSIMFTGCQKEDILADLEIKPNGGPGTDTDVTTVITRDGENGTIVATKTENGVTRDTTIVVPLGGINFVINPNDTIDVTSVVVTSTSFNQVGNAATSEWNATGVYYTKTVKNYLHTLNQYTKNISIDYLDAYTYVWGKRCDFPKANGSVAYNKVNVLDNGISNAKHYWLSETYYDVTFMSAKSEQKGYKTLRTDANGGTDEEISVIESDKGYQTLTPTTAKSWIEVTRTYTISGQVKTRYEVVLINGIAAPATDMKILSSFSLSQISPVLGNAAMSGNRTEGNIKVTEYSRNYKVGNNQFDKTFVLSYEKAVWSDGTHSFEMPYREYQGIADGNFNMTDMTAITGYNRKMYVHTMNATFNSNPASANAQTEIRVATETPEEDKMTSRTVIDEGFDYINPTTSNAWIKVREIWTVSGTKEYTKNINLFNGLNSPSKITKILANFGLTQSAAVLGTSLLKSTQTQGDFIVRTYERTYTVGNNQFSRVFTMSWQTATYSPMNHTMMSREYENLTDGGYNTSAMSNTTNSGTEYQRKNYVHAMSAVFNSHNASASGEAELWVAVEEEINIPSWLGNPIDAIYTRVLKNTNTGTRFEDMIMFRYQNGCVLAPNGVVNVNDKSKMFAYSQSTATAQGVNYTPSGANYSTAYWTGTMWYAAVLTIGTNWAYDMYTGQGLVVHKNDATARGIGVDCTPRPSAQSYTIQGRTITITYAVNNGSTTATTPLTIK